MDPMGGPTATGGLGGLGGKAAHPPGAEADLEAIYVLTVESRRITSARVAEYLAASPVSVSRALAARTPSVRLTRDGWHRAGAAVQVEARGCEPRARARAASIIAPERVAGCLLVRVAP